MWTPSVVAPLKSIRLTNSFIVGSRQLAPLPLQYAFASTHPSFVVAGCSQVRPVLESRSVPVPLTYRPAGAAAWEVAENNKPATIRHSTGFQMLLVILVLLLLIAIL